MSEQARHGDASPIIFIRPIGIAAGDAMRLMEAAKRLRSAVRWRMAPPGVAADAYLVHSFCLAENTAADTMSVSSTKPAWTRSAVPSASASGTSFSLSGTRKLSLDAHGWHRGRPVIVLGKEVDTAGLDDDELAHLSFPDALREMERGLEKMLDDLVGARMLYTVGSLAWAQRIKWPTHRLHAIEAGRLVGVVDAVRWQFFLQEGCSVERMMDADIVPMPRTGGFAAEHFHVFQLEAALWEFAKRCPEALLDQILPTNFLIEPLTHRRAPHLKEAALGDHCVAILRTLDTRARTAAELQSSLRMTRASLMRALTCLALVRAIQPKSRTENSFLKQMSKLWARVSGKMPLNA